MIHKFLVILVLLVGTYCQIEEETFREFFHSVYDLDRDGKFNFEDWVAYFQFIQPETQANSTHLRQTFEHYDTDGDKTVTLQEMMAFAQPTVSGKKGPKQIHIGFTGKDGEMQVMWITSPNRFNKPCAKYGLSLNRLNQTVNATYTTYNSGHLGFHGRIYKAVLTGLKPLQRYYYKVGDSQLFTYSETLSFVSGPNKGSELPRITFAVFGDMGTYAPVGHYVSNALHQQNTKRPLDFVFMNGDMAYAGINSMKIGQIQPIWDLFGQQTEKWTSITPFMPGVGNHQKFYNNFTSYLNRYHLPSSEGSNSNFWFSFDYGQLHLVHLSSEHNYTKNSQQYDFLENDLKKAKTNGYTKWIIVAAHHPFYCSDLDQPREVRPLAEHLEDLLNEYQVDIVQTGHQHCYERTWPVYKNHPIFEGANRTHYVKPKTPIYIVQGSAGALIMETYQSPAPAWSLRHDNKYGFGRVQIKANVLTYQFIGVKGGVIDQWHIVK